jgi:hypothetical protein
MMTEQAALDHQALDWLLNSEVAGVKYLALRELTGMAEDAPEMEAARQAAYRQGPIATILENMQEAGYWCEPGAGYRPKYQGTVWSIITLAQLGAQAHLDARILKACTYLLDHALAENGQFSYNGPPSGTIDCLQGNLCAALLDLGYDELRMDAAFEWMARTVTGEGLAGLEDKKNPQRYYAYKCGPLFACGANDKQPCAWGAVKVMLAFSKLPVERRTPLIERAIRQGVDFLFSRDPAAADYPTSNAARPSRDWWLFGFPVFYITDILQNAEALVRLGYGGDSRLAKVLEIIREKQDGQGRWALEFDYKGKTWVDFGKKKQPNPWVTIRAAKVLELVDSLQSSVLS